MPKVDRQEADTYERLAYPGRQKERTRGCVKTRLSDQAGIDQFGVGEVTLAPGASTGLYHWHENEDEFIYVLEGEVILVEGDQEFVLHAGDSAGFKAGSTLGHTFENRSPAPARLLEIGLRHPDGETAHYPGFDLTYRRTGDSITFHRADGSEYGDDEEIDIKPNDPDNLKPASPLDIA